MNIHLYTWLITIGVMSAVLLVDIFVIGRKPHEPSMKECSIFVGVFVGLAILFGIGVTYFSGPQYGKEFFAGWLTEYSLSLDNLFIFIIIMAKMKVPRHLQQYALLVGIILALVFRGIFIALGKSMIEAAAWVFFIFGAYLLYTALDLVKDYFQHDHDDEATENMLIRWVKRTLPFVDEWQGTKSLVKIDGKKLFTPMFLVIVALGSTDILFALDSIPAIYGLTQEPYLVFTANVFALMGLRQLYFLIGGLLTKLVYLPIGLSVILGFIGIKLVLHAAHHYHLVGSWAEINIEVSLGVIVATLILTTVASLMKTRGMTEEEIEAMH
ncbi:MULTISPECIES: TerC family protein [unclassified Luteococcus]|uniref:TerC family protein n=1 Tax=unclassified Luteococcus TaxID=2639923 RepID=UPI00313D904F